MNPKPFINDDFLLESDAARELYHRFAAPLPIIDYHCHLSPKEIAEDVRWQSITSIWLGGDHYKWRAMRTAGISETFCTGDAPDWEKFEKYAGIMPKLLRNPLYHWTQLELARYFGVTDLLSAKTAREIYDHCNNLIQGPDFSCRSLIQQSRVEVICTTDDPVDSLEHHKAIANDTSFATRVLPTWRPDKCLAVDQPGLFLPWIADLEAVTATDIRSIESLLEALRIRHDYFAQHGCRLSDRGVTSVWAEDCTQSEASRIFTMALEGKPVSDEDARRYKSFMLHELALMDAAKGWTMQIHFGALRSANTRMVNQIGVDSGFDSIGD